MNHLPLAIANSTLNRDYTGFQAHFIADFDAIVKTFGLPNGRTDNDKSDYEWLLQTPAGIATIYDYKEGHNYLGQDGKDRDDIKIWHIGGFNHDVVGYVLTELDIEETI